jgi:hypothetical protein
MEEKFANIVKLKGNVFLCKGTQICEHNKRKSNCVVCGGSEIFVAIVLLKEFVNYVMEKNIVYIIN